MLRRIDADPEAGPKGGGGVVHGHREHAELVELIALLRSERGEAGAAAEEKA